MARPLRIEFPGAIYHITSRGNARQHIFMDDEDRGRFLATLSSTVARFRWACHSYCLMGNHYHLLVETPVPNLSKGMRQLNGVYTQSFNRHHKRVGHLFQGRFKAVVVEKDAHLKELCRYVVLNPVRAKMVKRPARWKWSSYCATVGASEKPDFLYSDWTLSQFGGQRKRAMKAFAEFVREGIREAGSPWEQLKQGIVLGSDGFILKALGRVPAGERLEEVPKSHRLAPARPLADILLEAGDKKKAMVAAYETGRYSQREIAEFLGVHYCTVSRELGKRKR